MARFLKNREKAKGQSPGALIFVGSQKVDTVNMHLIDYDDNNLTEKELVDIKDGVRYKNTRSVTWINVNGLHDVAAIGKIGQAFDLHPLVMEDILNTGQRPKIDDYGSYIFIVLKMIRFDKDTQKIVNEQLSVVLAETFVLTFQERPGDVFNPVRERIRRQTSRIRGAGTDYLAYALMDTVVENYISVIEHIGDQIEDLEEAVLSGHNSDVMESINLFKRETSYLRKSIRPAREAVFQLSRLESDLIHEKTLPFLKDMEDLIIHATEAIDTYRDLLTDQLNIYNSVVANKMNDIMKVLTIFAAIFIPLTFIAGIYGTNFEYLPELKYKYSYFIFWGVLVFIAGASLYYFKKKKWF
ncbi:MAG: magnesium/cobalt transporter CorA [Desulfotignum sp.]|nr:magnesium/cobalt transporter CorA [Desulfotignum sp.]